MIHPLTAAYVVAVIFAATVVRTTLGFGEALVAVPLLALRLPLAIATPLAVVVSIIIAFLVVVRDWRHVELRSAVWLTLASLVGIPLGIYLLTHVSDHIAKAVLGAIIAGFGVYALRGMSSPRLADDDPRWLGAAGVVAGVMGGAYGMNGPPLAIYGTLRGWSPHRFRATLQAYFLIASLVGAIGYATQGLINGQLARYLLLSLPAVACGFAVGRAIANRLRAEQFVGAVYVGLVLIGIVLLLEGVLGQRV